MSGEEYIDVLDEEGGRIGTKERGAAHRNGDWHALVFVWTAYRGEDGKGQLLLQVRARPGDPFVGNVDAPAGGHVAAGETHREGAVREFAEEVGVQVKAEELVFLGKRRLENPAGPCRRVWQYFYVYPRRIGLEEVVFNEEVDGFVEVGLEGFAAVLEGKVENVAGRGRLAASSAREVALQIGREAVASYGPAILEEFGRSMRALRVFLDEGRADEGVWAG